MPVAVSTIPPVVLLLLGAILVASLGADLLSRRLALPRISMLVLLGVLVALLQATFELPTLTTALAPVSESLVTIALVMVAFLLGGDLDIKHFRRTGRQILVMSIVVVLASVAIVGIGLAALGFAPATALALAAIAAATDPAAVREVVTRNPIDTHRRQLLLGIVAIDDAWGILVFGAAMAVIGMWSAGDGLHALLLATWEIVGAVGLGIGIGAPAAALTGRLRPGEPTRIEAIALVLLLAGASRLLQVSPLLAAMTAGVMIASFSTHHRRSFRAIEDIEWPFLVFFFVFAGAQIDFGGARAAAGLTAAFIALRVAGRFAGGLAGARLLAKDPHPPSPLLGLALTPQAGVALGMALLVAERIPEIGNTLVTVTVVSTVVFEIAGPLLCLAVIAQPGSKPTRP